MRKELRVAWFAHADLKFRALAKALHLTFLGSHTEHHPVQQLIHWIRTVFQARQMSLEEGVSQEYDTLACGPCTHRHTTHSSMKQAET